MVFERALRAAFGTTVTVLALSVAAAIGPAACRRAGNSTKDAAAGTSSASATSGAGDSTESSSDRVTAGGISLVVLGADAAAGLVGSRFGPDNRPTEAAWVPQPDEVAPLVEGLPGALDEANDGRGREVAERLRAQFANEPTDSRWERYAAQVVGFVVGGKRLIYASFLCDPEDLEDEESSRQLVEVLDGGTCYFQVWFDPETGEYLRLTINGEA